MHRGEAPPSTFVCHIARDIANTGGGEVVRQVSTRAARAGHRVWIITDTPRDRLVVPGVRVLNTPFGRTLIDWQPRHRAGWVLRHATQIAVFTVLSTAIGLVARARGAVVVNHNCESLVGEVVVLHNVFSAELARRRLGRLRGLYAMVNPVRAMRIAKEWLLCRLPSGRDFVAVSVDSARDVTTLTRRPDRTVVIGNGVDLEHFSIEEPASTPLPEFEAWATQHRHLILFIGHEFKRKGLVDLLYAVKTLPDEYGLVVLGGAAEDKSAYRAMLGEENQDRALFLGEIQDVRPYLYASSVLALPSYYESLGLVGLEALASGIPIVITPEVPLVGLLVEGVNGAVCDHNPDSIASAIHEVRLESSADPRRTTIRQSVLAQGWDECAASYMRLVASRRAPAGLPRRPTADAHAP